MRISYDEFRFYLYDMISTNKAWQDLVRRRLTAPDGQNLAGSGCTKC